MKTVVTSPPTGRVVEYPSLKVHLRLDGNEERDYVLELEAAAENHAEDEMECSLLTQTLTATFYETDRPFNGGWFSLRRGPVQSVSSVTDANDNDITDYDLACVGDDDRIRINTSFTFPLTVVYVAGYGDSADVPAKLRQAIRQHTLTLYEQRASVTDESLHEVPHSLADFYRNNKRSPVIA